MRLALLTVALVCTGACQAVRATDLTALGLEQLLELRVVGASKYEQKQGDVAAAVSVITRQEIQAFGWRTLDQALGSLPGIHTTYDRQYSYVGTRGFGLPGDYNTRVLVTVNGNRVNDVVYDQAYVGRDFPLDLALVERIEFIPGPGGAVYGQNAMFGVVNVVTRQGGDLGGAELAVATQHPQRLHEGRASWGRLLDNGAELLLSVSGMRAHGEDRYVDFGAAGVPAGVARGLDGERDQELLAHVARGAWSFDFVHGDRRKDDPLGTNQSVPLVSGQYQADRFELAQLQYQERLAGDGLQVSGRVFMGQARFRGAFDFGTPFTGDTSSDWHGAELRLLSTAVAGHTLMTGIEAQRNSRADQAVHDLVDPANDLSVRSPGYRVGLYVQDEWQLREGLAATLGLRMDRNDRSGTTSSPRAALIWQATPETTLKALLGRAHRAPNAFERDYSDGVSQVANAALDGERIDTLEFVADHRVGRDLTLRGSLYRWTMRDLITQGVDPASGLLQYQSGENVKARGLELSADKTWPVGARLRGSVALQDVARANGARLLNSPRWLAKLNLSAPLPLAGLHLGYELRCDGRRLSLDGTRLGGYALSNLHLSTDTLAPGLSLSLGITNLFDKRHAQPGSDSNWQNALDQDGRTVRAEVAHRF